MAFSSFSELGQLLGMDIPPDTEPAIKLPHGGVPGVVTGRSAKPRVASSNLALASNFAYMDFLSWPVAYYSFRNRRLGSWRQAKRCCYCDHAFIEHDPWWKATKDHVMPKSAGGRWLVWACMRCNKAKGSMTPWRWAEFLDTCSFGGTPDPLAGRKTAMAEIIDELLEIGGGRARHDAFQEIMVEAKIEALVNEMLP